MIKLPVRYGEAEVMFEYDGDMVYADVYGKKRWELSGKPVEPLTGRFSFKPEKFIQALEGLLGIEEVFVESEEGISMRVSYDWDGWERGDDILKLGFIEYPRKASFFYLMRFYRISLTSFVLSVKKRVPSYSFKHWDVLFVRDEGELIVVKDGEEKSRFSPAEVRSMKAVIENHLFGKLPFGMELEGIDLSYYTKTGRLVFTGGKYKKFILKLYASVA